MITRFQTEVELLAVDNLPDGWEAQALDTGSVFEFVAGSGWVRLERPDDIQLVPAGGTASDVLAGDSTWVENPIVLAVALAAY